MQVFVLSGFYQYEGSYLLGVYASEAEARAAYDVFEAAQLAEDGYTFDWFEVSECELGAHAEVVRRRARRG